MASKKRKKRGNSLFCLLRFILINGEGSGGEEKTNGGKTRLEQKIMTLNVIYDIFYYIL
jgi:hypothetical protein